MNKKSMTERSGVKNFREYEIENTGHDIKFASLYSGCGGMDLGFRQAGLRCVHSIDFDKVALQNLKDNLKTETTCMDLGDFGNQHKDLIRLADVLVAGPPCQGFSTAGRNDPEDYRNHHVWNVARIASLVKPKVVVIENVQGLLNSKNSKHFEKTISILRESGYSVSWSSFNLTQYGIPQRRVRVIIVAILSDKPFILQIPYSGTVILKSALSDVEKVKDFSIRKLAADSNEGRIAVRISPGQKLCNVRSGVSSVHTWNIPEVFGSVTEMEMNYLEAILKIRRQNRRRDFGDSDPILESDLEKHLVGNVTEVINNLIDKKYVRRVGEFIDLTNTFNGKFRRLKWDDVSPTVDTRFGQPRYFLHPDENRGFSVREAARIQTFPDTFSFTGSDVAKYRMIGNAVPPRFAQKIAKGIIDNWGSI